MITGELRNKIDRLWETFWTGGITNPLDVVEQMTYLMFIHDLDETDNLRAKESAMLGLPHQSIFAGEVQVGDRTVAGEQLKWSRFHDFPAGQMYAVVQELVFPFIKGLHTDKDSAYAKYMGGRHLQDPHPPDAGEDRHRHGRDLRSGGAAPRHRRAGRYLRVPPVQNRHRRGERPVPHPPAHYPHDGGAHRPQGGRRDLRPRPAAPPASWWRQGST